MGDGSPLEDSPIRAIEANGEGFLVAPGHAAGAQERDEAGVRWVIGDASVAYHNCVVRADLSAEEANGVIFESTRSSGGWDSTRTAGSASTSGALRCLQ